MPSKTPTKKTAKPSGSKATSGQDRERASAARKALHQAVANLPTKPVEKLPMAALRTLPMVVGVGTFLVLFALVSYVPTVEKNFFGAVDHISSKTNELMDYTSLSASVGVSSFIKQITDLRREEVNINSDNSSRRSYSGRTRLQNRHKDEFNTFSESVHLMANSAASIYGLGNINNKNSGIGGENNLVIIEDNKEEELLIEEKRNVSIRNLETGKYICSKEIDGIATTTPGKCKI